MKQYITEEQLNHLTQKQRRNLDKYMSLKAGNDLYIVESFKKEGETTYTYREPLLSIGQMIEFLINMQEIWRLDVITSGRLSICDDLWEAVKEVLEK